MKQILMSFWDIWIEDAYRLKLYGVQKNFFFFKNKIKVEHNYVFNRFSSSTLHICLRVQIYKTQLRFYNFIFS